MQKYSVAFLLLCCVLRADAQTDYRVVRNEGIGVLLVDWNLVADTPVKHPIEDKRLHIPGSDYKSYICLKKNTNGYLIKCIYWVHHPETFDSTEFYIKPLHQHAVRLLTWNQYWDTVITLVYDPQKNDINEGDLIRLSISADDTLKYKILSTPDDNATPVRCQFFSNDCVVIKAIKGDWLKVSVSMYDDCSEWLVGEEKEAHPFKYKLTPYGKIITNLCFDEGWVRWKNEKECFLWPILW